MARHLHALPGAEFGEDLGAQLVGRAPRVARSTRRAPGVCGIRRSASISFRRSVTGSSKSSGLGGMRLYCLTSAGRSRRRRRASTSRTNVSLGRMRRAVAARTRRRGPSPFTSTTNDTRRSPGWRSSTSASCAHHVLARSLRPGSVISTSRTARSRTDLERRDLGDHQAARFLVALVLAAHEHHRIGGDRGADTRLNASGYTTVSTLPSSSSSMKTAMRSPRLVFTMPQAGHDAADRARPLPTASARPARRAPAVASASA